MQTRPIRLGRRALATGLAAALLGCSYGPDPDRRIDYVLFFQNASADLEPSARAIIGRAAAAAQAAPELKVIVAGYADSPVSPESNQILSRIRAQTVAYALVRAGVARDRIQLEPRRGIGADPGLESRRVEIRISP